MVTTETVLQVTNVALEAERREQFDIRAGNTKMRLRNIQVEDVGWAGGLEKVTEVQEDNENLSDPEDTEHMKLLKRIFRYFDLMGLLVGVKVTLGWSWKNPAYLFSASAILLAWVCMPYTAYLRYTNGDFVRALEPMVLFGTLLSCTQKWFGVLIYMESITSLLITFRTLCRRIDERSNRATVLRTGFVNTLTIMIVYTFGVLFTASFLLIIPFKVYISERVLIPILPMDIFFLDLNSTSGMLKSNFVQSIMGVYACVGTILYGLSFITLVSFYGIEIELLVEDFNDMDKMWADKTKHSVAYKHAFLKNICIKRQDMNRYLDKIKWIYETKLFYYFCVNYFSQILALYQILINDWQGGFGLACGLFIEMYFYCAMGTKVSKFDDRFCYIIYDTNWHKYDLLSQKVMLMLLVEAQQTRDFSLKFIGPLNLVTFITIVKSMYSYYTVLTEML